MIFSIERDRIGTRIDIVDWTIYHEEVDMLTKLLIFHLILKMGSEPPRLVSY